MSDYTPTTEEVRNQYSGFSTSNSNHTGQVYLNFAEFDRWLAEVKADAWEEGNLAEDIGPDMRASNPYRHLTDNPYRQVGDL